jgi:NADH-quinone oxidoreductase subunit L
MVESIGFEGIAINVWLVWIVPFVGAALIPALAKKSTRISNISAVGVALISAILATTLIPIVISGSEIHSQIQWISALNIKAGILADPLSIIMTNLVAWISSLIIIYSVGYMHGEGSDTILVLYVIFYRINAIDCSFG